MKTPAGTECPYFYGDYYRGKNSEECRLLSGDRVGQKWSANLCKTCPIPGISRANACKNMTLYATTKSGFLKNRRVEVTAWCSKSKSEVKVPEIGCELCHQGFDLIEGSGD